MKVALVCDFLTKFGGAQKVLLALHEIYPDAPIYCLLYDEEGTKGRFRDCKIIESVLKSEPAYFRKRTKFLLPKFPKAVEQFNLSEFDIVISSSDSFCHGVITKPKTFHISYCHTPMRYVWDWYHEYLRENKIGFGLKGLIVRNILHQIRIWDKVAADRVDQWLANSENVRQRIEKFYRMDAKVVYPPVDINSIKLSEKEPEDFYLIVSRIEPYKGVGLAVSAFNKNKKKLVIIGEGSERESLEKQAGDNIRFLGWQSDQAVYDYQSRCKAFLFPVEDDFGIAPVEAMAAGRPVIAYGKGGALETVIEGKTGVFFDNLSVESLNIAVEKFENQYDDFKKSECHRHAEQFSREIFISSIKKAVEEGYKKHLESLNH